MVSGESHFRQAYFTAIAHEGGNCTIHLTSSRVSSQRAIFSAHYAHQYLYLFPQWWNSLKKAGRTSKLLWDTTTISLFIYGTQPQTVLVSAGGKIWHIPKYRTRRISWIATTVTSRWSKQYDKRIPNYDFDATFVNTQLQFQQNWYRAHKPPYVLTMHSADAEPSLENESVFRLVKM